MIHVDAENAAGIILPLLFGHNLEHTRGCIWRGLSAQMLVNRKFAGLPGPDGVLHGWYPVGSDNAEHRADVLVFYAGN